VLVTRNTRDEAYYRSARSKERRMHEELDRLRRQLKQRILVGEPTGEVFTRPEPEKVMERLSEEARERQEAKVKEPPKKGQTKLSEF